MKVFFLKNTGHFVALIIVACIIVTGCVLKPASTEKFVQVSTPGNASPTAMQTVTALAMVTGAPALGPLPAGVPFGQLNISIGNYNAKLPVYIDNMSAGEVSASRVLNLKTIEGTHSVKVCSGIVCEMVVTEIKSGIKTSLDFEERLKTDAPQGSLNISIGDYPAVNLPVFIDNTSAGNVSLGKPYRQNISVGQHSIRVCNGDNCFIQDISVSPSNMTNADFGDQLKNDISQGSLAISIGGFDAADLPVSIDNVSAGNVSRGKPLNLKIQEGNHTVQVCFRKTCEKQSVKVLFAKQATVDFGDQFKADVEFPYPTIRIANSILSGSSLTVVVEFINPDLTDHTMSATVSCVYSSVDSRGNRKNEVARALVSQAVKTGARNTQQVTLSLNAGSGAIPSDPVLIDTVIK
jgi:hypothetical protein